MAKSIIYPVHLGGDGLRYSDDNDPNSGMGLGGHRVRFIPACGGTIDMAATAIRAAQTATAASMQSSTYIATSSTSVTPAAGDITLSTQAGKGFFAGQWLVVTSGAGKWFNGQVVSYAGTELVIRVEAGAFAGTAAAGWIIAPGNGTINSTIVNVPSAPAAADIVGEIQSNQIAGLSVSKLIGLIQAEQIETVQADQITGYIQASQLDPSIPIGGGGGGTPAPGSITMDMLAPGIRPSRNVNGLPTAPYTGYTAGDQVFDLATGYPYEFTGAGWVNTRETTRLIGQIAGAQISAGALDMTKFAAEIRPARTVASRPVLPNVNYPIGDEIYSIADGKRYTNIANSWSAAVAAVDVTGQIAAGQIAAGAVTLEKFDTSLRPVRSVAALPTVDGTTYRNGDCVTLQSDGLLYRAVGGSWTSATPASTISGQLAAAQIAALEASKITGQLSNAQLAAIDAAKVTGQLVASQLAIEIGGGNFVTNSSFEVDSNADGLADGWTAYTSGTTGTVTRQLGTSGAKHGTWAQQVTASGLSTGASDRVGVYQTVPVPNAGGKNFVASVWVAASNGCTGRLYIDFLNASDTLISSNSVQQVLVAGASPVRLSLAFTAPANTAKMRLHLWAASRQTAAGSVTIQFDGAQIESGDVMTAYAPRPDELLAGTVTTTVIADDAITAAKIVAGAVVAGKIAANAISANELQAGSVTTAKLVAGAVTANELAANSVIAGKIAANAISATELQAGSVTTAKLVAGAVTANELAAGSVIAGKIAANAVTANELAANSVVAGKVAAGAISTDALQANSVTTEKMILTGTNCIPNGDFATGDFTNWRPFSSPATMSVVLYNDAGMPAGAPSRYVLKMTPGSLTSSIFTHTKSYELTDGQDGIAVQPGEQYTVSYYGACSSGAVLPRLQVMVYYYKKDGTWTTTSSVIANTDMTTTWTQYTGSFTVPADCSRAWLYVYHAPTASSGNIYFTQLRTWRMASAELIVNGAITTLKLAAGAVTANELAANSVTAGKVAAGAISANELAANSVIAGKIAASAVGADQIAANAIRARHLLVTNSGMYLNLDPDFTDSAAWTLASAETVSPTFPYTLSGTAIQAVAPTCIMANNAAGTGPASVWVISNQYVPIDPASTYTMEGMFGADAGSTRTAYLGMEFYNSQGVKVGTGWGGSWSGYAWSGTVTADGNFRRYSGTFGAGTSKTIPAGVVQARIGVILNYGSGGNNTRMFAQGVKLYKQVASTEIKDGAVITDKIAANAVTAVKVDTDDLTANSAFINNLFANTFTARKITASEIVTNGMVIRDLAGNELFSASTALPSDAASVLGFNPQFSNWTGTYPAGWVLWSGAAPFKETTSVRTGPYAVGWTVSNETGMQRTASWVTAPLPAGTFLQGSFDINIIANNGGGKPGYLIRLYTNSALTAQRDTIAAVTDQTVGGWRRETFTARVQPGERIYGMTVYQMAAWSGMPGGLWANGSVCIFDNLSFEWRDASTDNTQQQWDDVGGSGKPQDNATVGANETNFTGQVGGGNLCLNSSFSQYSGTSGVADGWAVYNSAGGAQPVTASVISTGGLDNGPFQRIAWSVTNTNTKGVTRTQAASGGWLPNTTYVVSFYAKSGGGTVAGATMRLVWNTNPATTVAVSNPALTTSWQRYVFRITMGASVEGSGGMYISILGAVTGSLDIDHVQVQKGTVVTDWSGYLSSADAVNSGNRTNTVSDSAFTAVGMTLNAAGLSVHQAGVPANIYFQANSSSPPWVVSMENISTGNGVALVGTRDASNRQPIKSLQAGGGIILDGSGNSVIITSMSSEIASLARHADSTVTSTMAQIDGLTFALEANTVYQVDGCIYMLTGNTNNGVQIGINAPNGAVCAAMQHTPGSDGYYRNNYYDWTANGTTYQAMGGFTTSAIGTTVLAYHFSVNVKTTNAGTLYIGARSQGAGGNITAKRGSFVKISKLKQTVATPITADNEPWGMLSAYNSDSSTPNNSLSGSITVTVTNDGRILVYTATTTYTYYWKVGQFPVTGAGDSYQCRMVLGTMSSSGQLNSVGNSSSCPDWATLATNQTASAWASTSAQFASITVPLTISLRYLGGAARNHTFNISVTLTTRDNL